MSDERLRDLERRWQATGTVEDEAAYLAEQVRQGEVPEQRLHLAAYCGQPAAQLANARLPAAPERLIDWFTQLGQFGREPFLRGVLSVARACPTPPPVLQAAIEQFEEAITLGEGPEAGAVSNSLLLPLVQAERTEQENAPGSPAHLQISLGIAMGALLRGTTPELYTRRDLGRFCQFVEEIGPPLWAEGRSSLARWALGRSARLADGS